MWAHTARLEYSSSSAAPPRRYHLLLMSSEEGSSQQNGSSSVVCYWEVSSLKTSIMFSVTPCNSQGRVVA